MKSSKIKILSVFLLSLLVVIIPFSMVQGSKESKYGGEVRWSDDDIPPSLDVHHNMGYGTLAQYISFNKLIDYDPKTLEIEPVLAKSWEIPNTTTYIFHLRKDVSFHDGSKLNAEVVKWNFDRMMSEYSQVADKFQKVKSVKATGEYTVKVTLKEPFAPFLDNLISVGYIVSKKAVKEHGNEYIQSHPVGTGPFKFENWNKQKGILTFSRFENYWSKKPYLKKWTFVEIPEPQTRVSALKVGDVDVLERVPDANVKAFRKSDKFNLVNRLGKSNTIDYLTFNCAKPPFDKLKVRKAVALALDEETMLKFLDNTEPIYGPLPPGNWGSPPDAKDPPYDPEKAKELLKEAGYPEGFDVTLKIWADDPSRKNLATVTQSMLSKVGINVEIKILQTSTLIKQMRKSGGKGKKGDWTFVSLHWGGGGALDPNGNLRILFHSEMGQYNWISNYNNPKVNKLLDKALVTTNREKRQDLYYKAFRIIKNDHPMIWFGRFVDYMGWRSYVHGIEPIEASGYQPFDVTKIWLEKDYR